MEDPKESPDSFARRVALEMFDLLLRFDDDDYLGELLRHATGKRARDIRTAREVIRSLIEEAPQDLIERLRAGRG